MSDLQRGKEGLSLTEGDDFVIGWRESPRGRGGK